MADERSERSFLDDVPLEILEPVAPEVYALDPNPWAGHRPAPPLVPSPMGPAPYRAGEPLDGRGAWGGAPAGPHVAPAYGAHRAAAPAPAQPAFAPGPQAIGPQVIGPAGAHIAGMPAAGIPAAGLPAPGAALPAAAPRPLSSLALVSLILSVVGFGPIGAVLGTVALREIRRTGESGRELAIAGVAVGIGMTALTALILLMGFGVMLMAAFVPLMLLATGSLG